MTRKQTIGSTASLVAAGIFSVMFNGGCQGTGARTVSTGGPETITTIDHIDDQDWSKAATESTKSMLSQDSLFTPHADGSKCILAISRIINNTTQVVDSDLLVKQIRVTLNKSGKVVTTTIGGLNTEDPLAAKNKSLDDFENGDGAPKRVRPDYTLSGKLIETRAKADDIRQSTFYFQLTLSDRQGNAVWENSTPITKIGSHNSVGM